MVRAYRKASIWLAIGVFALPTLLGNSLHWVPGFSHGLNCCGADHEQAACHDCCSAHHRAPVGGDGWQAASHDGPRDVGSAHQCPICSFLAGSKAVLAQGISPLFTAVAASAPALHCIVVPAREVRPLGPRGPPLC